VTLVSRVRSILLVLPPLIVALVPALGAVVVWCVVGVINVESGLHIEYSLGSSAGWHSWFDRGNPGEVIRRWGVPVYDQWSGLGYRLPTQGLLTDTPLSYLAMVLPMNSVTVVAWLASLWFMFSMVHRWVGSWVSAYRVVWCVLVDSTLLGLMSFYTLWHGWQTFVMQVAGAVVCVVSLTSREVVESPGDAPIYTLTTNLSLGSLMLMMPHLGYGMTFAPTVVILFIIVVSSRHGALIRRVLQRPASLLAPLLALVVLLPGTLDLIREWNLQADRKSYAPEFGVLHFVIRAGGFPDDLSELLLLLGPLTHTFIFPIVALVDPESYQWVSMAKGLSVSWNAHPWPHALVQFHGGVLTLILVAWTVVRPCRNASKVLERVIVTLTISSMLTALLNTNFPAIGWLALEWIPVGLLSNSRWLYSDLALVLTLVLIVWRAEDVHRLFKHPGQGNGVISVAMRLSVAFGLIVIACVLPYRLVEPLQINRGQTRFSPLQVNRQVRAENMSWQSVVRELQLKLLGNETFGTSRVLIEGEGLMGAEGDNSWWGLRTHSQLRDIRVNSLLSWPRLRSGETLTPGEKFQQIVSDPICDQSMPSRMDFLAVDWAVLSRQCVSDYFPRAQAASVATPPIWLNIKSSRSRTSVMTQMVSTSTSVDYLAIGFASFHHWLAPKPNSTRKPCGFLVEDCIQKLGLRKGVELPKSPLAICLTECVARYQLTQHIPTESILVIPLKFDSAIRATFNDKAISVRNFADLIAIDGKLLEPGEIIFSIEADLIMRLRAGSPILILVLMGLSLFTQLRERRDYVSPTARTTPK